VHVLTLFMAEIYDRYGVTSLLGASSEARAFKGAFTTKVLSGTFRYENIGVY
jgi:hypothetical protein